MYPAWQLLWTLTFGQCFHLNHMLTERAPSQDLFWEHQAVCKNKAFKHSKCTGPNVGMETDQTHTVNTKRYYYWYTVIVSTSNYLWSLTWTSVSGIVVIFNTRQERAKRNRVRSYSTSSNSRAKELNTFTQHQQMRIKGVNKQHCSC